MIQKFKKMTILFLTVIFWVLLLGILLTINILNYKSNQLETRKLLSTQEKILELEKVKTVTAPLDKDRTISVIYSVLVDEAENYSVVFSTEGTGYSEEELIQISRDILGQNKEEGTLNHFRYKIADTDMGRRVSFVNYSIWEQQQYRMMVYSILIGVSGMILLFFIAMVLTKWLIKPVIVTFDKQKQFISDAGHELKTPLTVMKASLDMLESEHSSNKYFGYIREENSRMTDLIYELLSFSDLENADQKIDFVKIDLSRIVEGACLPFECVAFEKGLSFVLQIQEAIEILGNEKQIRQLIEILVDNAIKHTNVKGAVEILLFKEKGKAVLQVKNEGDPIPETERSKIFDRFYRVDKARNRKEGRFGLGLAIASSITELHKSKISVDCKENWIIFCVKF